MSGEGTAPSGAGSNTGATAPATSRSAALRERHVSNLDASANRRVMRDVAAGTVSAETYARYLAIEEDFVRTAVRVAGFCLWAEPAWEAAEHHGATIGVLLGEQLDYFGALRKLWVANPDTLPAVLEEASVLRRYVLGALDTGGYAAAVTGMFAAETLYLRWCTEASATLPGTGSQRPAALQDWLDLHTSASFAGQVAFLGTLVDALPADISDIDLDSWFAGMLAAENIFHDAVYGPAPDGTTEMATNA